IRRPLMVQHLRIRPIDKIIRQAPFWTPATVSAVFHIGLVCIVGIVYGMVIIICFTVLFLTAHLLHSASVDFIMDGLRGTAQSFCDLTIGVIFTLYYCDLCPLIFGQVFSFDA